MIDKNKRYAESGIVTKFKLERKSNIAFNCVPLLHHPHHPAHAGISSPPSHSTVPSMNAIPGLQNALKFYESEKVKERAQGAEIIREIFSNRENLDLFQQTAIREGGAAWIALFQCLFNVVILEKKALMRKSAIAQAERRLSEAVSLVRWLAELSVHLLSRKAFLFVLTHMTRLVVHNGQIFEPVGIDYFKALRTLLRYPPHLEHLDASSWSALMGICWSALLGDRVTIDEEWQEQSRDEDRQLDWRKVADEGFRESMRPTLPGSLLNEIASLIPILLSSSKAPLVPPQPTKKEFRSEDPQAGVGPIIAFKIYRYISQHPPGASMPPDILRSLNIVLSELEVNCRMEFGTIAINLFPLLVMMWTSRNKSVGQREDLLVAMRILFPYVVHPSVSEKEGGDEIKSSLFRFIDRMATEAMGKDGIRPLDFDVIRLTEDEKRSLEPFSMIGLCAGFGFQPVHALTWASLEIYADSCFQTYDSHNLVPTSTQTFTQGRMAKRQRIESTLSSLINLTTTGSISTRLLATQTLFFLVQRRWNEIVVEAQNTIKKCLVDLLDNEDAGLQSWSFVTLAALAILDPITTDECTVHPPSLTLGRPVEQNIWERVWAHAIRKTSNGPVSRAACHTVNMLLRSNRTDRARSLNDVANMLRNVDIQGPPQPYESTCLLFVTCLKLIRADVSLYSSNLEDKVVLWFEKTYVVDGLGKGKTRMSSATSSNLLRLLVEASKLTPVGIADVSVLEQLPDCSIVKRVLEERKTASIRNFILYGTIPPASELSAGDCEETSGQVELPDPESLTPIEGRPRLFCGILRNILEAIIQEWSTNDRANSITPERLRKSVDVVVLCLSFQGVLEINGIRPDSMGCLHPASKLLSVILPMFKNLAGSIPAQHLVWRGLAPLVFRRVREIDTWPMLLKPHEASGIRKDILPSEKYEDVASKVRTRVSKEEELLFCVWQRPEISETFKECLNQARALLDEIKQPNSISMGTMDYTMNDEDDDFGPIINSDIDAMPQSIEAKECERSTLSLLGTLVNLRLRGVMLASGVTRPTRDNHLINTLVSSDGPKFILMATVICDAIEEKSIRLSIEAISFVFEEFQSRLSTYAFMHDEGMLRAVISFLGCSSEIWLNGNDEDNDFTSRVVFFIRFLTARALQGRSLSSWKVRLELLLFINKFLRYDLSLNLWDSFPDPPILATPYDPSLGPIAYVLWATADRDARVRILAATSAARLHYADHLSDEMKLSFYYDVIKEQPGTPELWDRFLSDLLWKLNTCLASAQHRAASMFHLYEIGDVIQPFMQHLQLGLEAVSKRLGLESLASLYTAYANIVVENQLRIGQLPMRLAPRLCGFATRREFAQRCLETVGPKLLANHVAESDLRFFTALCEAANVQLNQALRAYFTPAVAITVAEVFRDVIDEESWNAAKQSASTIISSIPIPQDCQLSQLLEENIDSIISQLFTLLDHQVPNHEYKDILVYFDRKGTGIVETFENLSFDDRALGIVNAIDPSASISAILYAHEFLKVNVKNISESRIAFESLLRLFYTCNETYLVSEQWRSLRAIALASSFYQAQIANTIVGVLFLQGVIGLLGVEGVEGTVLNMVKWGFDIIITAKKGSMITVDLIVQLGNAYARLKKLASKIPDGKDKKSSYAVVAKDTVKSIENWLASRIPFWLTSVPQLETAMVFWPPELVEICGSQPKLRFLDITRLAVQPRVTNPMALCRQLLKSSSSSLTSRSKSRADQPGVINHFVTSTFWYLRRLLGEGEEENHPENNTWTVEGAMAFLDLLADVKGTVHAPSLEAIGRLKRQIGGSRNGNGRLKIDQSPETQLRVAFIEQIYQYTTHSDYRLRTKAFQALSSTLSIIQMLKESNSLPSSISALSSVLVPYSLTVTGQQTSISALSDDFSSWVRKGRDHIKWAQSLALMLVGLLSNDDPFYACLEPLLTSHSSTAFDFVAPLIVATLSCGYHHHETESVLRVEVISKYFTSLLQTPTTEIKVVETIIEIVLYLRHFPNPFVKGELSFNEWLKVPAIVLSEAAGRCGAFVTSLVFLEIASDQARLAEAQFDLSSPRIQKIMYDIYSNVEDPDGFYGIHNNDIMDSLLRRLDHEGQPLRALGYNVASYEASRSSSSSSSTQSSTIAPLVSTLRNLHELGFNSLAGNLIKSIKGEEYQRLASDPLFLDLAWRIGDWDVPLSNHSDTNTPVTSSERLYTSLRAVHRERDMEAAKKVVEVAIREEMKLLNKFGIERIVQIKQTTANLVCLREIALWVSGPMRKAVEQGDFDGALLSSFGHLTPDYEFDVAERLTATRVSLIRSALERENRNLIGDLISPQTEGLINLERRCHLGLSELSRRDGDLQAAVNTITAVRDLGYGERPSDLVQNEFSHILWAQGEHALAIQHLNAITKALELSPTSESSDVPNSTAAMLEGSWKARANNMERDKRSLAVLNGRKAHWISLAKLKAPNEIKRDFEEAVNQSKTLGCSLKEQAAIAHQYALFTDGHYVALSTSPELERLRAFTDRKAEEMGRLSQSLQSSSGRGMSKMPTVTAEEDQETRGRLERERIDFEEDRKARAELETELLSYLNTTLINYAHSLTLSDEYDDSMTRLCSIWLDQSDNEQANEQFSKPLRNVPTHKFLFLGPQLAARLHLPSRNSLPTSTGLTHFNKNLNYLVFRMARDHPYHILYQVITLGYSVLSGSNSLTTAKKRSLLNDSIPEPRAVAAAEILAKLVTVDEANNNTTPPPRSASTSTPRPNLTSNRSATSNSLASNAVKGMKAFASSSIQWCYYESDKKDKRPSGKDLQVPSNCPLLSCKAWKIPVATAIPPVDKTLRYEGVPILTSYKSTYRLAGGIHRPSIMYCADSNGKVHTQLFKGDDEVRQDAVMEQVFEMTNGLLNGDRKTKARNLRFRTYTVVPLANKSGVIEFVGNAMAIGDWLKEAHHRYASPSDLKPEIIRRNLDSLQRSEKDTVQPFIEYMRMFKPVMRHFFVERHKEPMAWFTMRLNYARSLAVTSIVGWMVGLGDRHCSNIMIDTITGELVHIDFGIVFEEGRKLRIPEKVPFRLTNDTVDGLGITGVDGTFRQCSEHVLRVLRDSSELILTVLEVFKHDPLYAWAGDPSKMRRAQGGGRLDHLQHQPQQSVTGQEKAERVLARIKQKLSRDLSVEYTVNQLIQEARDSENLAKIFVGWQPWL